MGVPISGMGKREIWENKNLGLGPIRDKDGLYRMG